MQYGPDVRQFLGIATSHSSSVLNHNIIEVHVPLCEYFVSQCKCMQLWYVYTWWVCVCTWTLLPSTCITLGGQGVVCSSAASCHCARPQLIAVKCVTKLGCAHEPFVCCDVALLRLLTPPLQMYSICLLVLGPLLLVVFNKLKQWDIVYFKKLLMIHIRCLMAVYILKETFCLIQTMIIIYSLWVHNLVCPSPSYVGLETLTKV